MILRFLPVAVFTMGLYKGVDKLKPILDGVKSIRAQTEIRTISQLLTADLLTGVQPESIHFREYLIRNLLVSEGQKSRDTSLDPWDQPYQMKIESGQVVVISGGSDLKIGTSDDLQAMVRW